jgi:hypothetical protein
MSSQEPETPQERMAPGESAQRVEAVLQELRSGVRQRQAEAATARTGMEGAARRILDLRQREFVQEPIPFSHRQGLGRLIVLARKATYKLFGRWWGRAVLEQQNGFNQIASQTLQDLIEEHQRALERLRALESRLAAAEDRQRVPVGGAEPGAGPVSGGWL